MVDWLLSTWLLNTSCWPGAADRVAHVVAYWLAGDFQFAFFFLRFLYLFALFLPTLPERSPGPDPSFLAKPECFVIAQLLLWDANNYYDIPFHRAKAYNIF